MEKTFLEKCKGLDAEYDKLIESHKETVKIAYKKGYLDGMNHNKAPEDEITEQEFEATFPNEALNI